MEQINDLIQKWTILQYAVPAIIAVIFWIYSQNKINAYQRLQRAEEQKLKELEQKESALSGTIKGKIIEGKSSVTVHFGQSHISVSIQALKAGMNLQPFSFIGDRNITMTLKDDSILVSADFRSFDGKIVAQIISNEWHINPNNYFDRNYDENGLEIIDQDGITKFQIDYTDLYNIRIGGSFISNGSVCAFLPSGQSIFLGIKDKSKEELIGLGNKIETLFLYPSKNNFGKRREVDQIRFSPDLITDFGKNNPKNKLISIVPDTMEVKGINFGGQFKNTGQPPLKLRIIKFEVYFNNKLQNHGVIEKGILLSSESNEEWMTPQIYFNDAMESIPFSEAKKLKYKFFITAEYSGINGNNKKTLNIAYSVILTNTGPAYANISKL